MRWKSTGFSNYLTEHFVILYVNLMKIVLGKILQLVKHANFLRETNNKLYGLICSILSVCPCLCVFVCIHQYLCACSCVFMCTCICGYMLACVCVCVCVIALTDNRYATPSFPNIIVFLYTIGLFSIPRICQSTSH